MLKHSLFLGLWLLCCADVAVSSESHTLFAVDLSLSSDEKDTAFEIIKETTLTSPETHSVGLTLFDDTVRGFIAPAPLDQQQIKALHRSMADAPDSVRRTSNLAVGIERAIDAFKPQGGANLVVFSRGAIDTESQDPRAQFVEWLERVLLQEAADSDIAVSLVVSQNQLVSKQIKTAFSQADRHRIIVSKPGVKVAPELVNLLNIPDRAYGASQSPDASGSDAPVDEQAEMVNPDSTNEQIHNTTNQPPPHEFDGLAIIRLVLLAVLMSLLIGIVLWRYGERRASRNADDTSHSSSTYLPLTQKPSETMDHYTDRSSDTNTKPSSRDSGSNRE